MAQKGKSRRQRLATEKYWRSAKKQIKWTRWFKDGLRFRMGKNGCFDVLKRNPQGNRKQVRQFRRTRACIWVEVDREGRSKPVKLNPRYAKRWEKYYVKQYLKLKKDNVESYEEFQKRRKKEIAETLIKICWNKTPRRKGSSIIRTNMPKKEKTAPLHPSESGELM